MPDIASCFVHAWYVLFRLQSGIVGGISNNPYTLPCRMGPLEEEECWVILLRCANVYEASEVTVTIDGVVI